MSELLIVSQILLMALMAVYFMSNIKTQSSKRKALESSAGIHQAELSRLNSISLTQPLSEKTRPSRVEDIVGQEDGLRALEAALCGKNPQHIIIYGPPGVGKTCAARIALNMAKKSKETPFMKDAKFIEMDATCIRFDERSIADPLLGSVHDPIYQGAGAYGQAGIPQPKPGAVTRAHGGVLFLDEIGELHPMQMNKLLKVMEDRRVFFESAYYSREDKNIPPYIHDIFANGMPADFRLIGATTRSPESLPPALRSRAIEVFFRPLFQNELEYIALNGAKSAGMKMEPGAAELAARYSSNGRDVINIVQMAVGLASSNDRDIILLKDVEWIAHTGQYSERPSEKADTSAKIGRAYGLAVSSNQGFILGIESAALPVSKGNGKVCISGFAEQESMDGGSRKLSRKSSAIASIDNVLTMLNKNFALSTQDYELHISAAGGSMVDGPSAGVAIAVSVYSALTGKSVSGDIAFTGEVSLCGDILPVGGVRQKLLAAELAGINRVFAPSLNKGDYFGGLSISPVDQIGQVISSIF